MRRVLVKDESISSPKTTYHTGYTPDFCLIARRAANKGMNILRYAIDRNEDATQLADKKTSSRAFSSVG